MEKYQIMLSKFINTVNHTVMSQTIHICVGILKFTDCNSCPFCVILKKKGHSCVQYHNNYNTFTISFHKSYPVSVFLKNRSKKMAGHEREEYGILNN